MGIWRSFSGSVCIRVTTADIPRMLSALFRNGVDIRNATYRDELTVDLEVMRSALSTVKRLLESSGCQWQLQERMGSYWHIRGFFRRPVLVVFSALLLFLSLYLPTRVLFVQVVGCSTVPEMEVIQQAASCGISFWTSARQVRSEKVKNALLSQIPQLQWVGVNTKGCVAIISVEEKSVAAQESKEHRINHIVAVRDGLVDEVTVIQGSPACQIGQTVKKGQMLISGYTDCGIVLKGERAEGEVYAQTLRDISVISPRETLRRGKLSGSQKKYSLQIGKKLIKLWKDSGISYDTCVKITERKQLELPGGFKLPVTLICETYHTYSAQDEAAADMLDTAWLENAARDYIVDQMVAGQIRTAEFTAVPQNSAYSLNGRLTCREMIGRVKYEEILDGYGEID